jgi:hypothetical protein
VAQGGDAVEPFDTTRPNIARVWDYWLGGKDNFAADRELAEKMLAVHPVTAQMARENRQFPGRAVSYVAARGIRQFIDVGAGLPTVLNTHDIARHVEPDARVVYVDNDPIVISHARSLLAKSPGVTAVPGDMRDPGRILADPGQLPDHLRRFRRPVGGGELHLGIHGGADLHPFPAGNPGFLRRPRARAAGRGLGARLVRRRPGTAPGAAHRDLRGRGSPQAVTHRLDPRVPAARSRKPGRRRGPRRLRS